ncbi:hypothetical protein BH23GEM3_BH23GEM3_13630 [soil metagenome]
MNRYRLLAVLLCAAALTACEKNAVRDLTGPLPSARVKFFNFGVNAPGVNFYANDTKMTAISSATGVESTIGINYGGGAPGGGGLYSGIQPGQYTFSGRIAAAVDKDLPISNVTATIADGKHYSFYQSGIYDAAAKTVDGFVVEDVFPATIDWSVAHVRFVHAISNADPMTLYAQNTETGEEIAIGGAVAYKSGGAFTALPNALYDLSTRSAASTTNVIVRTNVAFNPGRVYTIGAMGNLTLTTGATAPVLHFTANR